MTQNLTHVTRNCKPGFMMKAPPHYSNILATAIPARIQEILCQDRADPRTLAELKELVRPPHSDWFLDLPPDLQWWVYLQMFEAKGIDVSWIPGYHGGGDFNPSDYNLQDILKWKFPAETRTRTKEFKTKAPASGTATDSGFSAGATVPSSTGSSDEESSTPGKDEPSSDRESNLPQDSVSLRFVDIVIVAIGGLGLVGGLVWYVKKKRAEADRILEVGSIASEDSALALRVLLDDNEVNRNTRFHCHG